jgi:protein-S-isoprenylcysteine O-methyltransferase Ste14
MSLTEWLNCEVSGVTGIGLFFIGTLFFLWVSWRPLMNPGSHGFYRFFAFEGILLLVLLNFPYWFVEPVSLQHLVSWSFLLISILLIIQAVLLFKRDGGHAGRQEMPENFSFENTARLVESGLYRFIRHPMYSSLLFLAWGAFLKHITPLNTVLIFTVSAFLTACARVEERENIRFFGATYDGYMKRTKMFIPWLF